MVHNPYMKMKQNAVFTASPGELTLMLYEGAIKFANQAVGALENNDIALAHNKIIRVQDIIQEFRITLDRKYEISETFEKMYQFIDRRLVEANAKKSIEIMEEVLEVLRELRDMWKEVMKLVKQQPAQKAL